MDDDQLEQMRPWSDLHDKLLDFLDDTEDECNVNRVHMLADLIRAETTRARLEALDEYVQDLKDAFREYVQRYPDADSNDFIGLIAGVRNQPHRLAALDTPQAESGRVGREGEK